MNEKEVKKVMNKSLQYLLSILNTNAVPERKKYLLTNNNFKIIITGSSRFCDKPTIVFDGFGLCLLSYIGKNVGKIYESSNLVPHGSEIYFDETYQLSEGCCR
jgi:hypothetical protein